MDIVNKLDQEKLVKLVKEGAKSMRAKILNRFSSYARELEPAAPSRE